MSESSNKFSGKGTLPNVNKTYASVDSIVQQSGLGRLTLGTTTTYGFLTDPKQIGFRIARHKFVAKMLSGSKTVLEVGCQEGFTALFVAPYVERLIAVDNFKGYIEEADEHIKPHLANVTFRSHDIIDGPVDLEANEGFDAAFSMDVLEHIDPTQEHSYMSNIAASLNANGIFIVGMPSLESQKYASDASKAGHINCKTGEVLRDSCRKYYRNVFMFGMNDEVLHTGYFPMCQYLIALCVGKL
jgi:2-polyprenyl-3-methyl-5-hydroxy-6-metoxy-1,4-benzoquinol methylase